MLLWMAVLSAALAQLAAAQADFEGCLSDGAAWQAAQRGTSIRWVDPWQVAASGGGMLNMLAGCPPHPST
jgi:hypothetical protein